MIEAKLITYSFDQQVKDFERKILVGFIRTGLLIPFLSFLALYYMFPNRIVFLFLWLPVLLACSYVGWYHSYKMKFKVIDNLITSVSIQNGKLSVTLLNGKAHNLHMPIRVEFKDYVGVWDSVYFIPNISAYYVEGSIYGMDKGWIKSFNDTSL